MKTGTAFTAAMILNALYSASSWTTTSPNGSFCRVSQLLGRHPSKCRAASGGSTTAVETTTSFIDTELRGAAMKLHTRQQAPVEGEAVTVERAPYQTTHMDYLHYLVDSQHVFKDLEKITDELDDLSAFRNSGLERSEGLEKDIAFMCEEFSLQRPPVGAAGTDYAQAIRTAADSSLPAFMCHFYNFYFAHTAGGRMIGKKMSAMLLSKKTLEFYKWDGDVNVMKANVKASIEEMASQWSEEERQACVKETAAAFRGGGAVNANLSGSNLSHSS